MAGTLTISTLSDGTNSTSSTNCIQGSAKAWVNFAGATGAINGSYNVSSVTRNGTGDYTVNYTNAMSNANYAVNASISPYVALSPGFVIANGSYASGSVAPTTSSARVGAAYYNAAGAYDPTIVNVSVFSS